MYVMYVLGCIVKITAGGVFDSLVFSGQGSRFGLQSCQSAQDVGLICS